jgi:FtsP/CotA-like multicopper oxidase with cupredoxin domain
MGKNRRHFLQRFAWMGGGLLAGGKAAGAAGAGPPGGGSDSADSSQEGAEPVLVETPDVPKLPWKWVDGVKEFQLIAEPVRRQFLPGKTVDVWGFNGSMPGPTIEIHEGDRVRIVFENRLPEISAVHWHGLEVPIAMDGVPGVSMDPVAPGGRFVYEFTVHQHGTFFYHSHMPMQEMLGMIGFFIVHPKKPYRPHVARDYAFILQEWALLPNNSVPNTLSMEFNWLTMNGRTGPDITPLLCKPGERVRIRFVNMGMDHHPMHMHGHQWVTTGTEGGRVPEAAWTRGNTELVGVAQARVVEFDAKYLGDWMLHCHLPHHMMNQMVSMVGPMSHGGAGMHSGMGMEEGMGMVRAGGATAEELGPAFGRSLGHGTERERATTHLLGQPAPAQGAETPHVHGELGGAAAKKIPGFPQDMWMPMDHLIDKPETFGLRKEWTASMMGMMTLVRVLPPELFDEIERRRRPAGSGQRG